MQHQRIKEVLELSLRPLSLSGCSLVVDSSLHSLCSLAIRFGWGNQVDEKIACTLEEVDEKTKAFRASLNNPVEDDESTFSKLQASACYAAFVVPAKAIELYLDLRRSVEEQVRGFTEPLSDKLLPDLPTGMQNVFTLVLDLNETLVYSDWKDLSKLNRDPKRVIYISGHALESCLQPENCVEIKPWKSDDLNDTMLDLIPFLEFVARSGPPDTRQVLESYKGRDIAKEFIERSKEHQRQMQEQKQHGRFWQHRS